MGKTLKRMMLGLPLVIVIPTFASSQTADPFIGTWKLSLAKSEDDPGTARRSSTLTFEDRVGGVTLFTCEGIDAQGNRIFEQYAAKDDGKDYPFLQLGAKAALSVSRKRVDAYTLVTTFKADGKVVNETVTETVSKDGKTMTVTVKGTNAQGQRVNYLHVYERQ